MDLPVEHPPFPNAARKDDLYAQLISLSQHMLELAKAGDWDQVTGLEASYASLVNALRTLPPGLDNEDERNTRMDQIRQLLAYDAAIRDLAQPRLKELQDILSAGARARHNAFAYR